MATIDNARERAAAAERMRELDAMERLVLAWGTRTHYAAWLDCFPEDIVLDAGGGVSRDDLMAMAEDENAYNATTAAFAAIMLPVLQQMAQ